MYKLGWNMAKTLILCVDRDNDIGEKTKLKTPLLGREKAMETANSLALADPEDSDSNSIFEGIKVFDGMKKDKKSVELALVAGDSLSNVKADEKLDEEISKIVRKTKAEKAIVVSDGAEDEHIIPIIQNYLKIASVDRVIVKQSEKLEGLYYMIHDFIENPKMAKIFLGIPAIAFLLYAFFGATSWRLILGGVGAYLMIKGFQLESWINYIFSELSTSFTQRRISFFLYIVSLALLFVGAKIGYDNLQIYGTINFFESIAAFIYGSMYIFFLSFLSLVLGRVTSSYTKNKNLSKYLVIGALGFAVSIVLYETSHIVLEPEIGLFRFFISILFGLLLVVLTLTFERILKSK